jgi:diguanylate cyclase (GGDEF)-like protein
VDRILGDVISRAADDYDLVRKRLFAVFLLVPVVPLFGAFAIIDLLGNEVLEGVLEAGFALMCAVVLGRIRRMRDATTLYRIALLWFTVLLALWAATGADGGVKLLWAYPYPMVAMFVLGKREGLAWSGGLYAAFFLTMYPGFPWAAGYRDEFVLRFFLSWAVVLLVATLYESIRNHFYYEMLTDRSKLEAERQRLEAANARIRLMSVTDGLTGVFNRAFLNDRLPEEIKRVERYERHLAVILCDLDRFKSVNDDHGHQCGDALLAAVATALEASLRDGIDWVARYGGEEFLVVLPETDLDGAAAVAERLRRRVARVTVPCNLESVGRTSSFGVAAVTPEQARRMEMGELLDLADRSLYEAKQRGRNRVVRADEIPVR